ncbi:MAG TPA: hypothetical protein VMT17_13115 [Anaeromyxobacteraceae bacterium]|nr:hypothetical protein [Anaeromyxobacteraceae bacterium]
MNRRNEKSSLRRLTDDQMTAVAGGQWKLTNPTIPGSHILSRPGYRGPTLEPPSGSIAQGDTLDNTLTENGLP